jgi:cytochrome c2
MKITHVLLSLSCLFALSACPAQESTQEGSSEQSTSEAPPSGMAEATDTEATPDNTSSEVLPVGNAEGGPQVFIARGCTACHAIKSLPEAKGNIGPALDGVGERAATRVEGLDAMAYLKQSIEQPDAYLVEGYQNMMVKGLHSQMSPQEYADLLAYLMSLKS